ncbi:ABC transporter permease [Pseudomonas sp. FP198]|jgi:ABC-type polysaccharide/polyol phosphate export permease|uniref:ABC transporter permease n=1 Tax=Pseudomonas sp. FP198 TaxID=2954084 RepID=UPI0027363B03|nr:ABC transporter permease [Pseudomonas sp. FP198]WLG96481.1 ABC transporter permease [Pseudomonas sp. FP198]
MTFSARATAIKTLLNTMDSGVTLALRNIRLQMREHALGYAWALIIPMLYAVCYIFIKRELTGSAADSSDQAGWDILRAFAGITLFQCWMQIVQEMSNFIRRQRGLLRGLDVGPTPFVLAIVFEGGIAVLIRSVLIILAIPLLGLAFPSGIYPWLIFIACILALLLSATTIGLLLAPWSVLYADVRKALTSMNLPIVLISPIFYPATERLDSMLYWINIANPMASPLAVLSSVLQGQSGSVYMLPMLVASGISLLLLSWLLVLLRRQVPILLERMGN